MSIEKGNCTLDICCGITLTDLVRVIRKKKEPTWRVKVNGKDLCIVRIGDLLSFRKFQIICAKDLKILPDDLPKDWGQSGWIHFIRELLEVSKDEEEKR